MNTNNIAKAHIINVIIQFLGLFACIPLAFFTWGTNAPRAWAVLGGLAAALIFSICLALTKTMLPRYKAYLLICVHLLYITAVLCCTGNDRIMFSLMSLSQIIWLLAFEEDHVLFQMVLFELYAAVAFLCGNPYIEKTMPWNDYLFCMVEIAVQTMIFRYIIFSYREKVQAEKELIHSSKDLLKVVEKKCDEALIATKSKSEFLANMSHEIRTPINAVLGMNEMVLREAEDPDILGYAHDIKTAGTTLLNIINDVLDLSKIESGKMEIIPVSYDLSSVLNDLVNMINIKANDKGISFKLSADAALPRILVGDEVRLKQVIINLLTNAVKYTEEGFVKLEVGFEKTGDFEICLSVTVEDSGIGIRQEDLEKLFARFERIEEGRNRNIEGTGLGMTIAQTFLHMMGSRLEVSSEYGRGSRFHFEVRQEVENWECMGDYEEAFRRLHNKSELYIPMVYAPRAHILVVDDMPMNINVFRGLLKQTGIRIDEALSGASALEKCSMIRYDAIFLDHMMPDMDGIETHEHLIHDEGQLNADTPIIVLTANAITGARGTYMSHGFMDYLTKPIDPEKLEKTLLHFLPEQLVERQISGNDAREQGEDFDENLTEIEGLEQIEGLERIEGLCVSEGIRNAGGIENYRSVLKELVLTIDGRSAAVEDYLMHNDLENYTIQVHALKSALRIVGFAELGELASDLEKAGNENNEVFLSKNTERFLCRFRQIKGDLSKVLESDKPDDGKPELDEMSLAEMLMMILQAADDFDYDLLHSIVTNMSDYKLPENFAAMYDKICTELAEVNFDAIRVLALEYLNR